MKGEMYSPSGSYTDCVTHSLDLATATRGATGGA